MPRSLTKKRERQKQWRVQPTYERVARFERLAGLARSGKLTARSALIYGSHQLRVIRLSQDPLKDLIVPHSLQTRFIRFSHNL